MSRNMVLVCLSVPPNMKRDGMPGEFEVPFSFRVSGCLRGDAPGIQRQLGIVRALMEERGLTISDVAVGDPVPVEPDTQGHLPRLSLHRSLARVPVSDLDLPERLKTALRKEGIHNVAQLVSLSRSQLMRVPGIAAHYCDVTEYTLGRSQLKLRHEGSLPDTWSDLSAVTLDFLHMCGHRDLPKLLAEAGIKSVADLVLCTAESLEQTLELALKGTEQYLYAIPSYYTGVLQRSLEPYGLSLFGG